MSTESGNFTSGPMSRACAAEEAAGCVVHSSCPSLIETCHISQSCRDAVDVYPGSVFDACF